jgi:hypothetical protein
MADGEIVPGFLLWVLEISDHRQVDYGWPLTNHEGSVRQLLLQNRKEIIQPVFQKPEHFCVGRRCKDALETVRRHIARQFVIIPEKPSPNFKLLPLISPAEPTVPLRKPKQDWRCLRETLAILFKDRYLPHLIDGRAPLCRPGDTTGEVRPDRLERLTTGVSISAIL